MDRARAVSNRRHLSRLCRWGPKHISARIYTRYSDDLAFSTSGDFTRRTAERLVCDIERVLLAFGHALHRKKTTISPPGARKIVLGLLVGGDHLKLTSEFRKRVANHVRGIEKFGLAHHAA